MLFQPFKDILVFNLTFSCANTFNMLISFDMLHFMMNIKIIRIINRLIVEIVIHADKIFYKASLL